MDHFKFISGNLEISNSSRENVVIDIFVLDKKNNKHLLAEFKKDADGDGFIFKNYIDDLNKKISKLVDSEQFVNFFHLMCYIINNFVLSPEEELAFPEDMDILSAQKYDSENEGDEESFLDDISNIDFKNIKKNLQDED